MAGFQPAIDFVFQNEGGFTWDSLDTGGATKYGISTKFLNKISYPKAAKDLTKEDALYIYLDYFWKPYLFYKINDQKIANDYFDLSVNAGIENDKSDAKSSRAIKYRWYFW